MESDKTSSVLPGDPIPGSKSQVSNLDNPILNSNASAASKVSPTESKNSRPAVSRTESQDSRPAAATASCAGSQDGCPMAAKVRSLIYWKNPLLSGLVLLSLMVIEFSFMCCSAISVVAYTGLAVLVAINLVRLYYHYVAKTDQHLIKEYLERDIAIPRERVTNVSLRLTDMVNDGLRHARDVFFLKDLLASAKFGILLYLLTYIGAGFNFLTLVIIVTAVSFTVPKFYECYKLEIDKGIKTAVDKIRPMMSKVTAQLEKMPVFGGRKEKSH